MNLIIPVRSLRLLLSLFSFTIYIKSKGNFKKNTRESVDIYGMDSNSEPLVTLVVIITIIITCNTHYPAFLIPPDFSLPPNP